MNKFSELTKAFFYISLTALTFLAAYLIYINPNLNTKEMERIKADKELKALEQSQKSREWKYDVFSDVDITGDNAEKYPIVVMRSGFKVIKSDASTTLVGWEYDVVNVSPQTRYKVSVDYTLTDADSFKIATGSSSEFVPHGAYRTIRGTINVDNSDVERLYGSTWLIGLDPNWTVSENKTSGKKYERLVKVLPEYPPFWIQDGVKNEYWIIDEKLKALVTKYKIDDVDTNTQPSN